MLTLAKACNVMCGDERCTAPCTLRSDGGDLCSDSDVMYSDVQWQVW